MRKTRKQKSKKYQTEPEYMSVSEAAHIYSVAPSTASRLFDEAAADGVELLQFIKAKRINRKLFRAWIQKTGTFQYPV